MSLWEWVQGGTEKNPGEYRREVELKSTRLGVTVTWYGGKTYVGRLWLIPDKVVFESIGKSFEQASTGLEENILRLYPDLRPTFYPATALERILGEDLV